MNYNEKVRRLVESLDNLTEKNLVQWIPISEYMDSVKNRYLKRYLIEFNSYVYDFYEAPYIEEYRSYCATINGGIAYLFTFAVYEGYGKSNKKNYYICAIQSSIRSEVIALTDESIFQNELQQLYEKIENSMLKVDVFVDSIIKLSDENK